MRISVNIGRRTALAGICYALSNNDPVNSLKDFKIALAWYIESYGECMEDNHISEHHLLHSQATEIVNKYFK